MNHSPNSNDGTLYGNSLQQQQSPSNIHIMTNDPTTRAALQQQQQQQAGSGLSNMPTSSINMQSPSSVAAAVGGSNTRVINRNYLQIQQSNNYATATSGGLANKPGAVAGTAGVIAGQQQPQSSMSMYAMNTNSLDPKRARSISNSLKSLLMPRSTSRAHQQQLLQQQHMLNAKKREKSYDTPSAMMQSSMHPYDTQSGKRVFNSRFYTF